MKIDVQEINEMKQAVRFEYLRQAEKTLVKIKKSSDINSDCVNYPFDISIKSDAIKSKGFIDPEQDSIFVKVIANTANWIDSQLDMIVPGAWSKSINEKKGFIPHLHDHLMTLTARVGDVKDIYESEVSLRTLGIEKEGTANVLVFESDVKKGYNENVFNQYKNGQVNQHSISLRYIDLQLALNDETDEKHYSNWQKYITMAINPQKAEEFGYFWIVKELKLIENSAVLFGANELTGTLETRSQELQLQEAGNEPPQDITKPAKVTLSNYINDFKL